MLEDALLSVGLLIVVAKLAEGIFRRFRLNSIVAYTATGVLLGPVLGGVEPPPMDTRHPAPGTRHPTPTAQSVVSPSVPPTKPGGDGG